jgi:hypothetical protein
VRNGKIWNETVWISAKQNETRWNLAKRNETRWNVVKRNETRWNLAKRNEILLATKRNESKFCEIFWFAKHAKFCKTDDEFRLVLCFAKLKKHAKLETLLVCIFANFSVIGANFVSPTVHWSLLSRYCINLLIKKHHWSHFLHFCMKCFMPQCDTVFSVNAVKKNLEQCRFAPWVSTKINFVKFWPTPHLTFVEVSSWNHWNLILIMVGGIAMPKSKLLPIDQAFEMFLWIKDWF